MFWYLLLRLFDLFTPSKGFLLRVVGSEGWGVVVVLNRWLASLWSSTLECKTTATLGYTQTLIIEEVTRDCVWVCTVHVCFVLVYLCGRDTSIVHGTGWITMTFQTYVFKEYDSYECFWQLKVRGSCKETAICPGFSPGLMIRQKASSWWVQENMIEHWWMDGWHRSPKILCEMLAASGGCRDP